MAGETTAATSKTQRRPLTRERVVAAGLDLLDEDGIEGLSMRRLGAALGVEAMSLYNHVDSKDDLLDAVVEHLWGEIAARVDPSGQWREDVVGFADAVHGVAHDHPQAYPLMLNRGVLPDRAVGVGDTLVRSLREAGFGDGVGDAVRAIVGYAAGYTMSEIAWYGDPGALDDGPQPVGAAPPGDDEAEPGRRVLAECDTEAQFAFGLEVLLDGLEARRDAAR